MTKNDFGKKKSLKMILIKKFWVQNYLIQKNLEKNYLTKKYGEKNDFAKKLLTKMKTIFCNENFVEKFERMCVKCEENGD